MFKLIFFFIPVGHPLEPLQILRSGELVLHGMTHCTFTGQSALDVDKFIFGSTIPSEPVYTITFDPQKLLKDAKMHSLLSGHRMNKIELKLCIDPQERDVEVIVAAEGHNSIMYDDGVGVLRHSH